MYSRSSDTRCCSNLRSSCRPHRQTHIHTASGAGVRDHDRPCDTLTCWLRRQLWEPIETTQQRAVRLAGPGAYLRVVVLVGDLVEQAAGALHHAVQQHGQLVRVPRHLGTRGTRQETPSQVLFWLLILLLKIMIIQHHRRSAFQSSTGLTCCSREDKYLCEVGFRLIV